jgi:hypothetical protein
MMAYSKRTDHIDITILLDNGILGLSRSSIYNTLQTDYCGILDISSGWVVPLEGLESWSII